MKKRWMIILIAVSMMVFGSLAFAGDNVQDKATSESNLSGAVMLAKNSQASPQVDDEALEKLRVKGKKMAQDNMLIASLTCTEWCGLYSTFCLDVSQSDPTGAICDEICNTCGCSGCSK